MSVAVLCHGAVMINLFLAARISGRSSHVAKLRSEFDGGMYFISSASDPCLSS